MKLVTNLEKIKTLSDQKENENWRFRTHLKSQDSDLVDIIVHRLNKKISAAIDCTTCGNCCRSQLPEFTREDIDSFSEGLNISSQSFIDEFLVVSSDFSSIFEFDVVKGRSCPFLCDTKCSNYEFRPKACQSYPHLHKEGFISRTIGVIYNSSVCPIVYNVWEGLKRELNF